MEFYPFSDDLKYERTWKEPGLAILLTEHHPISLWVPVWYGGDITHCGWVDIYTPHDIPLLPALGKASDIPESSDSQSCFTFIQNCLLDCRQHTECNTFPSSTPPKRLLHLEGPLNSSELSSHQNLSIRLCETNGQPHRYATLSYCWGSAQTIKTSQTNIRKFQAGIDWNALPKTFQEAVIVALRLEIRYLWIDALCIIQDDKIDWDTEAAKMGDIYQNSYLTIAATSSPSSEIPFLRPRPPGYKPKTLQFSNPHRLSNAINNPSSLGGTGDIISLKIRQGPTISGMHLSELLNPRIHGALTTRGWALQERVLSNRIVHFTDEGIKWECRMSIRNEDQRRCFPGHVQRWKGFSNTTGKNQPLSISSRPTSERTLPLSQFQSAPFITNALQRHHSQANILAQRSRHSVQSYKASGGYYWLTIRNAGLRRGKTFCRLFQVLRHGCKVFITPPTSQVFGTTALLKTCVGGLRVVGVSTATAHLRPRTRCHARMSIYRAGAGFRFDDLLVSLSSTRLALSAHTAKS